MQAIVSERPGSSIQDLADALGIQRTAVVHHLRTLGRTGHVRSVRMGRRLLVFPAAATPFEGLVGMLRLPTVHQLAAALQAEPGLSVRGLARALQVTPRAVRYHLLRLRDLGFLEMRWGVGGRRRFAIDPKAMAAFDPGKPVPAALQEPITVLARI